MDFQGMKRKKLRALCKKHGIPANLKNIEMANRLSTLFQEDQTSPVRFKSMSDILSECSVIESQRDEASVAVGKTMNVNDDKSLVGKKTDETLVTSEYNNTDNITVEEEEMEIKEGCMSVGHCVSNTNELELLSSANRHGDLSEYNTESSSSAEEQADILSVGHCVRESLDEVSIKKPERTVVSSERGCELNVLEVSGSLSSAYASSLSPMEEKVALHQLLPINNASSSVLDESYVFTTPERNLIKIMEEQLLNQNGKTLTGDSVNHQSDDEAVESHGVVFTTHPEQVLLMGDYGLDEKQEEHTSQNGGGSVVVDLHDESNSAASLLIQPCVVGDFNGDGIEKEKEISSKGSQAGQKATQGTSKKSKLNSPHVDSVECNPESELLAVRLPTGPILVKETVPTLIAKEDTEANEETLLKEHRFEAILAEAQVKESSAECWNKIHSSKDDEKGSLVKELQSANLSENNSHENISAEEVEQADICSKVGLISVVGHCVNRETMDDVNALSADLASVDDRSTVFTTPERYLFMMDQLSPNGKTTLAGDSVIHHTDDEAVESHLETRQHLEKSEPHTVGKQEREEVEMKDVSAFFTRFETCLLLGESTHGIHVTSGSSHHDSSPNVILKNESMVRGSHISALDLGAENVAGLDATQGTSKQSRRGHSPHVDSANLFDLEIDGADTTYVLAGTCSLVPGGESSPSTTIHNQINDALEELVITDIIEADDLIQTKATT